MAQRIVLVALDRTACGSAPAARRSRWRSSTREGVGRVPRGPDGRTPEEVDRRCRRACGGGGEAEAAGVLPATLAEFLTRRGRRPADRPARGLGDGRRAAVRPGAWGDTEQDIGRVTARIALDGVARAACALKVPVADVVVAAGSTDTLGALAARRRADGSRSRPPSGRACWPPGLRHEAGAIDADTAEVVHAVIDVVPVERVVATIRGDISACEPLAWQPGGDTTRSRPRSA